MPTTAKEEVLKSSQPAAAPSPEDRNTETPSPSAICHRLLKNALPPGPIFASQVPKLRLMMGGGLALSIKFTAARRIPGSVLVSEQEASLTLASGATAPAHSASREASNIAPFIPGSVHPGPG